jgi:hypothetical protein
LSEIRADTISDAAGTGPITLTKQSAAKAWVNFNGTGTIAVRDSLNVSSLTDSATGDYLVNFTNNMSNSDYVGNVTANPSGYAGAYGGSDSRTTGSLGTKVVDTSNVDKDSDYIGASAHGDLA